MRNRFRIIGGAWRGRKFTFPESGGLRPSPDRVRETLFNWLAPSIDGAMCLDLFAGSGALGLEALSRGATTVTFVDADREAARSIRECLDVLGAAGRGEVVNMDVAAFLATAPQAHDVVFVDPPYRKGLVGPVLEHIARRGWVRDGGFVYVEAESEAALPPLPAGCTMHRSARAGQVGYHLVQARSGANPVELES